MRRERHWAGLGRGFVLCVLSLSFIVPLTWMVGTSFKPRAEADETHIIPKSATLSNYPLVLGLTTDPITHEKLPMQFGRWYFNSIFITLGITILQVLTSAMAAYAFSRLDWYGRDQVFLLYLSTMMIPSVVTMIPTFQIMVSTHLINTYQGLVLPAAFTAFGTFLLRQFMIALPVAYDEAAKLDGASHWTIFWEIILPLSRPGLIALGIMTALAAYQSFFWPLIMLNDAQLYTLPIGMLSLDTSYGRQTELIMAATVMNILPLIMVFVIFQKYLVKGLQLGGVKG